MEDLHYCGSTSCFRRVKSGVVLKYPIPLDEKSRLSLEITKSFQVERQILQVLGTHPRIVQYLGQPSGDHQGLLLAEASHGDLQQYIDTKFDDISSKVRNKWCIQAVESIAYIHSRGVIHSDLRPENFLVHATSPGSLDLWLSDFGGSTCDKLGLDGGHLPDSGFFDPKSLPESNPKTDIFSIASVIYTIVTGHWPFRGPGGRFETGEEMREYSQRVDGLFERCEFPDVNGLFAGNIMTRCWSHQYESADDLLEEMSQLNE